MGREVSPQECDTAAERVVGENDAQLLIQPDASTAWLSRSPSSIMFNGEPWRPAPPGLEARLAKEVSPAHPLFGRRAISVGRRDDCDDVLFFLTDNLYPLPRRRDGNHLH